VKIQSNKREGENQRSSHAIDNTTEVDLSPLPAPAAATSLPLFRAKDFARVSSLLEQQQYAEALVQYQAVNLLPASVHDCNVLILLYLQTNQGQAALNEYQRMVACGLATNEITYALMVQMKTGLNLKGHLAYLDFMRREMTSRRLNLFNVASIVLMHMCMRMNELHEAMEMRGQQQQCEATTTTATAEAVENSPPSPVDASPLEVPTYAPNLNEPTAPFAAPVYLESISDLTSKLTPRGSANPSETDVPIVEPLPAVYAALKAIGAESYFLIFNTLVDKWNDSTDDLPRLSLAQYLELMEQGKQHEADALVCAQLLLMSTKVMRTPILDIILEQAQHLSPRPNLFVYNSIIEDYAQANRKTELMMACFARARELFPALPLGSYNAVLYHCIRWMMMPEAMEFLGEAEARGIAPPLYRETWMVAYQAKLGMASEAVAALRHLQVERKARESGPNAIPSEAWREALEDFCYNMMIEMYAKLGDHASIIAIRKEMRRRGVSYNTNAYNNMIDFHAKCGQYEKAEHLFAEMRARRDIVPSNVTWHMMLDMYVKANQPKRALETFDEMGESGLSPCSVTFNILLDMCARLSDTEKAIEIWERMKVQNVCC
jgi:pentatricopeptide repeat protein